VLARRYAGVVFDIDGVLVRGEEPIAGAAETVRALQDHGVGTTFVTNNASRTAEQVAAVLRTAGIPAEAETVVTSALAAAELLDPGIRCLVIGMDGLREALADRGCVETDEPLSADAVVVGWDRTLVWDDLRRATLAVAGGARFVGTNADASYPAPEGRWPGNGAVLAALQAATGRRPEIAGKPEPPLFRAAAARLPDGDVLMVGDRHETDVVGAARLGWDTALVLTGVTRAEDVDGLDPAPTYVLEGVSALTRP
jgi:HAD superfamily hydrolase (TIGR01457 family)